MRTLNQSELKKVNGGALVAAGVIIGSFIGGYIYGKLTKEDSKTVECEPTANTQCI